MCARYTLFAQVKIVSDTFRLRKIDDLLPRYNIAPTQQAPVVLPEREARMMRWGLVPSWAKDPSVGQRMINARAETLREKPSFRSALRKGRCVVPASGFFEWNGEKGNKQPHFFHLPEQPVFGFAGLHERWDGPEGLLETFTIITTAANELMTAYHDRMPVILDREGVDLWLGGDDSPGLLAPYPPDQMAVYPVSRRVGSPSFDEPECVAQLL